MKYWKEEKGYSFSALVTVKRRHAQFDSGLKQVSHKYTCNWVIVKVKIHREFLNALFISEDLKTEKAMIDCSTFLYLVWVPQGLSQHLLYVPHYGHLLMSFQRVLYPLRSRSPLEIFCLILVNLCKDISCM